MESTRKGGWMQTRSGLAWYHQDPRAEDVRPTDIAFALSNTCRFGGHVEFYSVAEHAVLVSLVVPPHLAHQGLCHDDTEAYVVDVPRPLKKVLGQVYADVEALQWGAIAEFYGLPLELDPAVKDADNAVLLAEKDALLGTPPGEWSVKGDPAPVMIRGLEPKIARALYLQRLHEVTGGQYGLTSMEGRVALLRAKADMADIVSRTEYKLSAATGELA